MAYEDDIESALVQEKRNADDFEISEAETFSGKRKATSDAYEDEEEDEDSVDDDDEEEDEDDDDDDDDDDDEEEEDEGNDEKSKVEKSDFDLEKYDGSEEQKRDFQRYEDEFLASDGFDVETFPRGKFLIGFLSKLNLNDKKNLFTIHCKKSVRKAIKDYNKKQAANLELVKIIKANRERHARYYVTLEAKDKTTGKGDIYQAKIYSSMSSGELDVEIFRPRKNGNQKVDQAYS